MLFVTRYSIRGDRTPERIMALLEVFGERGDLPGTIGNYQSLDGRAGFTIVETDDPVALYQTALAYQEWLELETTPIIATADAVPHMLAELS